MSYVIRREFSPSRSAILFEFDPQSEAELLRDFPWLRRIGDAAFQHHRSTNTAQAEKLDLEPAVIHDSFPVWFLVGYGRGCLHPFHVDLAHLMHTPARRTRDDDYEVS